MKSVFLFKINSLNGYNGLIIMFKNIAILKTYGDYKQNE